MEGFHRGWTGADSAKAGGQQGASARQLGEETARRREAQVSDARGEKCARVLPGAGDSVTLNTTDLLHRSEGSRTTNHGVVGSGSGRKQGRIDAGKTTEAELVCT